MIQDLLLESSDEHAHHGVAETYEDRIAKLIRLAHAHVHQYDVCCDEGRCSEHRVLQDLELVQKQHDEERVQERAEEPEML